MAEGIRMAAAARTKGAGGCNTRLWQGKTRLRQGARLPQRAARQPHAAALVAAHPAPTGLPRALLPAEPGLGCS